MQTGCSPMKQSFWQAVPHSLQIIVLNIMAPHDYLIVLKIESYARDANIVTSDEDFGVISVEVEASKSPTCRIFVLAPKMG